MNKDRRIALVTQTDAGAGLETARQLGRTGLTVLVGARDRDAGQVATQRLRQERVDAHLLVLDVTDQASVGVAAGIIEDRYGRLDVLVNNATAEDAAGAQSSSTPVEAMCQMLETHVVGTLIVVQAMLPLLRRSQAGWIVNLFGSELPVDQVAEHGDPVSQMVARSTKTAALNALTAQLAHDLRPQKIAVNAARPGLPIRATDTPVAVPAQSHAQSRSHYQAPVSTPQPHPARHFLDVAGEVSW